METEEFEALMLDCLRQAKHQEVPNSWSFHGSATNHLCGDTIEIYLDVEQGKIVNTKALCKGCSVSQASGVLVSRILGGTTIQECTELAQQAQLLIETGIYDESKVSACWSRPDWEVLRELLVHMHRFPLRYNCVLLPWRGVLGAVGAGELNC